MGAVFVFASTSGIAKATVEVFLERGYALVLAARNADALTAQARDLKVKFGVEVPTMTWDLHEEPAVHQEKVEALFRAHDIDGLLMAAGVMPPQEECERDPDTLVETIQANFTAVTVLLNLFAERFLAQKKGFISCISSVAGDRGRPSNYIYGASKAGLSAYLEGLRSRLHKHGLLVQTVKPGPVRTPMTDHLKDSFMMATPEQVGRDIVDAIERKQDVLYTPFYWRYVMSVIRWIPDSIFKRLPL